MIAITALTTLLDSVNEARALIANMEEGPLFDALDPVVDLLDEIESQLEEIEDKMEELNAGDSDNNE